MTIALRVSLPFDNSTTHGPYAINTFHFNPVGAVSDTLCADSARLAIIDFYTATGAISSAKLQAYISQTITNVVQFSWRNTAASPGTPFVNLANSALTISTTNNPLPNQVCCVLSAQAVPGGGVSRASSLNRVFLGPLSVAAMGSAGLLDTSFVRCVADAGGRLAAWGATHNASWCAYSTKLATSSAVFAGWVDNRPDIQRRRADAPSIRTAF